MITPLTGDRIAGLKERLANARRVAVIGIGDELSPVDRLGMLAAREIDALHLPGVAVFLAGTVPESMAGPVRNNRPDHILLLDSAEMGLPPGTMAVIPRESLPAGTWSTHALALSLTIDYLEKETGANVTLLGIQPDPAWMNHEITARERERLDEFITGLSDVLRNERITRRL